MVDKKDQKNGDPIAKTNESLPLYTEQKNPHGQDCEPDHGEVAPNSANSVYRFNRDELIRQALSDDSLNSGQLISLIVLAYKLIDDNGLGEFKHAIWAEYARTTPETIGRHLKHLESRGYVQRIANTGRGFKYKILVGLEEET